MSERTRTALLERYRPRVSPRLYRLIELRLNLLPLLPLSDAIPQRCSVYELGCGIGILSNFLALEGRDRVVIGLDLSLQRIELARRAAEGLEHVTYHQADVNRAHERVDPGNGLPRIFILSQILYFLSRADSVNLLRAISGLMTPLDVVWIIDYTTRPFWKWALIRTQSTILYGAFTVSRGLGAFSSKLRQSTYEVFGDRRRLGRIPSTPGWEAILREAGLEHERKYLRQGGLYPNIIFRCQRGPENPPVRVR